MAGMIPSSISLADRSFTLSQAKYAVAAMMSISSSIGEMVLPLISVSYLQVDGPKNAHVVYIQAGLLLVSLTALLLEYFRARRYHVDAGDDEGHILVDNEPIGGSGKIERNRLSFDEEGGPLGVGDLRQDLAGEGMSLMDDVHAEMGNAGGKTGAYSGVGRPGLLQGNTAVVHVAEQHSGSNF